LTGGADLDPVRSCSCAPSGAGEGNRAKLKVSRLTTCFSLAAHLGSAPVPVTAEDVLWLTALTPRERLLELRDRDSPAETIVNQLEERYEAFLRVTQRPEGDVVGELRAADNRRAVLHDARVYGDPMFELLTAVCAPSRLRFFVI
jgi:hypothetical protein